MPFKQNDTLINRNGRPVGKQNKTTSEIKGLFQNLLENNISKLQRDFDELQPSERIKYFLELASFIIPKQKAVEVTTIETKDFEPIILEFNECE